jgi:hypothetical protein
MNVSGTLQVLIDLAGSDTEPRIKACQAAFGYAQDVGIDEIRLQPDFMERPPPVVDQAVQAAIRGHHRRWGRGKSFEPSADVTATCLQACPYLKSVLLLKGGRMIVGAADAADSVVITINRDRWAALQTELTEILGPSFRFEVDELRDDLSAAR